MLVTTFSLLLISGIHLAMVKIETISIFLRAHVVHVIYSVVGTLEGIYELHLYLAKVNDNILHMHLYKQTSCESADTCTCTCTLYYILLTSLFDFVWKLISIW
jgi:hypothetical protein